MMIYHTAVGNNALIVGAVFVFNKNNCCVAQALMATKFRVTARKILWQAIERLPQKKNADKIEKNCNYYVIKSTFCTAHKGSNLAFGVPIGG
jgi:hypothetical protein